MVSVELNVLPSRRDWRQIELLQRAVASGRYSAVWLGVPHLMVRGFAGTGQTTGRPERRLGIAKGTLLVSDPGCQLRNRQGFAGGSLFCQGLRPKTGPRSERRGRWKSGREFLHWGIDRAR